MKVHQYREMMRYLTRPPAPTPSMQVARDEELETVQEFEDGGVVERKQYAAGDPIRTKDLRQLLINKGAVMSENFDISKLQKRHGIEKFKRGFYIEPDEEKIKKLIEKQLRFKFEPKNLSIINDIIKQRNELGLITTTRTLSDYLKDKLNIDIAKTTIGDKMSEGKLIRPITSTQAIQMYLTKAVEENRPVKDFVIKNIEDYIIKSSDKNFRPGGTPTKNFVGNALVNRVFNDSYPDLYELVKENTFLINKKNNIKNLPINNFKDNIANIRAEMLRNLEAGYAFNIKTKENKLLSFFDRIYRNFETDQFEPVTNKNGKIIGYKDTSVEGKGKTYYGAEYKGELNPKTEALITNHPDNSKIQKYIEAQSKFKERELSEADKKIFINKGYEPPKQNTLLKYFIKKGENIFYDKNTLQLAHANLEKSASDIALLDYRKNLEEKNARAELDKIDDPVEKELVRKDYDEEFKRKGIKSSYGGKPLGITVDIDPNKQLADYDKYIHRMVLKYASGFKDDSGNLKNIDSLMSDIKNVNVTTPERIPSLASSTNKIMPFKLSTEMIPGMQNIIDTVGEYAKPVAKGVLKGAQILGTPLASASFYIESVISDLNKAAEEGDITAKKTLDAFVGQGEKGLFFFLPELSKNVVTNPIASKILQLGSLGRLATPAGIVLTAGGVANDLYDQYVNYQKMTPEEKKEFIERYRYVPSREQVESLYNFTSPEDSVMSEKIPERLSGSEEIKSIPKNIKETEEVKKPEQRLFLGPITFPKYTSEELNLAMGGRVNFQEGSEEKTEFSEIPPIKENKPAGGIYFGVLERRKPIVATSGGEKEAKEFLSSLITNQKPAIGYGGDNFNVYAAKSLNPYDRDKTMYEGILNINPDSRFFVQKQGDYTGAGFEYDKENIKSGIRLSKDEMGRGIMFNIGAKFAKGGVVD